MGRRLRGFRGLATWLGAASPRTLFHDLEKRARFRRRRRDYHGLRADLDTAPHPAEAFELLERAIPGGLSQIPEEILGFLDYLATHPPTRTIVEIGVEAGGTTSLLARTAPNVRRVVAVDLFIHNEPLIHALAPAEVEVHTIWGSSHDAAVRQEVIAALEGDPVDVLFIDGDHSFRGVLQDFRDYSPLVRPGGIIAFHDIVPDAWLRTGGHTSAYAGEVPFVWPIVRRQFKHREFVANPRQEGRGIGALVFDPRATVVVDPAALIPPLSPDAAN